MSAFKQIPSLLLTVLNVSLFRLKFSDLPPHFVKDLCKKAIVEIQSHCELCLNEAFCTDFQLYAKTGNCLYLTKILLESAAFSSDANLDNSDFELLKKLLMRYESLRFHYTYLLCNDNE